MAQVAYSQNQAMPLIPPVRGWRWRKVKPCGTAAAYRRHLRHKIPYAQIDDKCKAWHRADNKSRKAKS